MKIKKDILIPATHPSLAGHFPGHPIVPGVLLVDKIVKLIQSEAQGFVLKGINHVKFMNPLLPDLVCHICIDINNEHAVFDCRTEKNIIAKGRLQLIDKEQL